MTGCRWIMELFKSADKNGDGCLNLKEIVGLMKTLNIEVDLDTAKDIFQVRTAMQGMVAPLIVYVV